MASFRDTCHFPAYCADGNHLVTVNMFDSPRRCPEGHKSEPVPYSDKSLLGKIGPRIVASWLHDAGQLELTNGKYLCPVCHKHTLTFADGGEMWD